MISSGAPKRNEVIEPCQRLKARRNGLLNPAAKVALNTDGTGMRSLDYTCDAPAYNYNPDRRFRLPEDLDSKAIGALTLRLNPVSQPTTPTVSSGKNGGFHQHFCGYDSLDGVFNWPNRDPLGEPGTMALLRVMRTTEPLAGLPRGPVPFGLADSRSQLEMIPFGLYMRSRVNLYEFNFNNPNFYVDPDGLFPWAALGGYYAMWSLPLYKLYLNFEAQLNEAKKHPGTPTFCHYGFGLGAVTLTDSSGNTMTVPAFNNGNYYGFIPGTVDQTVVDFFNNNTVY
jgi:hypothetical protein